MNNFISFAQYHIDSLDRDFLDKYWDYNKNEINPYEISYGSNKKVWIKCQEKSWHGSYEISCKNFTHGNRCKYCGSPKFVNYFDSIAFLYHRETKAIVNNAKNNVTYEDMYKVSPFSRMEFYTKCGNCGYNSDKCRRVVDITKCSLCKKCSDGRSIPEKFMTDILEQLKIDFITELSKTTFQWCENYRYDFYIPSLNMIIETHGEQHYGEGGFKNLSKRDDIQNDKDKEDLARINGIDSYIIINCKYSSLNWLRENITQQLNDKINLSTVNWNDAWQSVQKSQVVQVWELWKVGLKDIGVISEKLQINRCTTRDYLKRGKELNIIDYDEKIIKNLE